jgi:hypothetical protein
MEPNKFENEIREQLNSRTIQPSENSWDRLDAMLTVAEHKSKRSFKWIYIAASFVGFTLIGFFLFNQQKNEGLIIPYKNVVIEEKQPLEIIEKPEVSNESTIVKTNQTTAITTIAQEVKIRKSPTEINQKKEQVLDLSIANTQESVEEVSNSSPTAVKINPETLLANVEKGETLTTNTPSSSTIKVDPTSLLSSVEKEVDESFRDKAIQALNKKYKSVKTVLANRNSQ